MPVELIKNPLKVSRIIGESVFSTVVEEDINVPDINPDLYKILASSAAVRLKDCETANDKVTVNGQVLINVLYSADVEGKPLHNMDVAANFSQGIEIPGARAKMKERINVVIQHVECHMINSRKVNVKVIMDINCRVEDLFDLDLSSDVRGISDMQVLREPGVFKQVVGWNKDRYEFNEEFQLPSEMPQIDKVLRSDYKAVVKEDKAVEGKVEVIGILGVNMLYKAADEGNTLHCHEFEAPFTQYIEIPAADRNMECSTDNMLQECYIDIGEDSAGERRVVNLYMVLDMSAKVYRDTEQEIIVDAYSPSSVMELEKSMYEMDELIGRNRSSIIIKETMGIKHGDPEIESVCYINVMPVVNETKLLDDRVVVEGLMECTAIYRSSYSGEPMCSMTEQIPFRHFIDIPGVKLGMHYAVNCDTGSVSFSQINSEMLELKVALNFYAEVMKHSEKKLVERIEETEGIIIDAARIPAVTIYMVQKGDTLWSIAKRYNTTVDALAKMNNIENPSKLAAGMQLMILKNIRMGVGV